MLAVLEKHNLIIEFLDNGDFFGSLSKRTDAKILIIIFKLLDESLIVFFVLSREENYIIL